MIDNACDWGVTTLLIFSENVGTLVYYTHMFPLLISLFLGLYVFLNNPKRHVNRVLFFVTLMFSIWVYFDLILWASPTPESVIFFWSLIVPVEMYIYLGALYLIYLFSTDQKDASLTTKILASLFVLPILLFAHTDLNVMGLSPDCDIGAHEGPLISYMYIAELVIIAIAIFVTARGYRRLTSDDSKKKLLYIGVATIIFLLFFSAGNLTLLFEMGPFYEQYKLFGMPIFAAVVAYTIVRYQAFRIKTVVTELLVAALWILLFSVILIQDMANARPIIGVTLIIFAILGFQLSLSVRREVQQRVQIEKLAEDLEKANRRLKVLDQMKSEFVSIASHQLRSPLTSIRGYSSMLLEGSFGKLVPKAKEAVERIAESSRFMALSVEDYLNVSRIESGRMKYEVSDFNLKEMAERIVDDVRPTAIKKGLLLTFKSSALSGRGVVQGDIGKTQQIIHNLLDNAIKYTQKGSITVAVFDNKTKKKVYVEITDTGVGMTSEMIHDVFEKFVRARNANKVNVTGTGLGLYVARQMAEGMKGSICASSAGEGKGSTFTLVLPMVS